MGLRGMFGIFRKVCVSFVFWIIFFWRLERALCDCLWREKVGMQFTNLNFAAFLSSSLILWMLDSKSATKCYIRNWLLGIGTPKFLPRLTVFATGSGIWMSVRLVNQESMSAWSGQFSSFFDMFLLFFFQWDFQIWIYIFVYVTFSFDNVQIVDKSSNYKKPMILEMTHIASNPNSINQRSDTENLSVFYHPLLNRKPWEILKIKITNTALSLSKPLIQNTLFKYSISVH